MVVVPVPVVVVPVPAVVVPVPAVVVPVPGVVVPVPGVVAPVPGVVAPVPGVVAQVPGVVAPVPGVVAAVAPVSFVSWSLILWMLSSSVSIRLLRVPRVAATRANVMIPNRVIIANVTIISVLAAAGMIVQIISMLLVLKN